MTAEKTNNEKLIVYSTSWCSDCHRTKYLLDEYGVAYVDIDVERSAEGMAFVKQINHGRRVVPTIVFPDGSILVEPSNVSLATKLGLEYP